MAVNCFKHYSHLPLLVEYKPSVGIKNICKYLSIKCSEQFFAKMVNSRKIIEAKFKNWKNGDAKKSQKSFFLI